MGVSCWAWYWSEYGGREGLFTATAMGYEWVVAAHGLVVILKLRKMDLDQG